MPRIVVTGCGRAGTQYLVKVLQGTGFNVTHERVFNHDLDPIHHDLVGIEYRWKDIDIDVSWLSAPFLKSLSGGVVVWHQMRNPIKTLTCWVQHRILSIEDNASRFVHPVLPQCAEGSDLERGIAYILDWTRIIEDHFNCSPQAYRYQSYNIEDLTPCTLSQMLMEAGLRVNECVVAHAMEQTSRQTGSCGFGTHVDIPWNKILATPRGYELLTMTKAYGYEGV